MAKYVKTPKRLYKEYRVGKYGSLLPVVAGKCAYNANGQRLTERNAVGFKARRLKGKLEMCVYGYHAGTLRRWFGVKSVKEWKVVEALRDKEWKAVEALRDAGTRHAGTRLALYLVELHEVEDLGYPTDTRPLFVYAQGGEGKYVGRSYTIIKRVA